MRRAWVVVLLLVGAMALAAPASAQVREQRPNLIGGELMGRGVVLTLNYERFLTNEFGLGAGFMALGASGDFVGILPLYASMALGDIHAFYLSAGTTLLFGEGSLDDDFDTDGVGSVSLGYQYQSPGGFFVRPLFSLLFDSSTFLVWPGLTIGGSF